MAATSTVGRYPCDTGADTAVSQEQEDRLRTVSADG